MRVSEVFYYIVSLSLMGSILAAGLLIIKALLGQRLGAKWHYGIWFVLVVRLLIPYIPSGPANVLSFIPHYQQVVDLPQISMPGVIETNSSPSGQKTDNITVAPQQNLSGNTNTEVSKASVIKTWINWKNASESFSLLLNNSAHTAVIFLGLTVSIAENRADNRDERGDDTIRV
jgi:hypothetical protein